MGYGLKLLVLLFFISFLYVVGIFLFTRGFLLKRLVINEYSDCTEIPDMLPDQQQSRKIKSEGCWMKKTHKKAVILIIDALRYDFALYNKNVDEQDALPYQNKLKVIHEVLENSPQHGALFKFVADPPTTTMQRLKALTTGKELVCFELVDPEPRNRPFHGSATCTYIRGEKYRNLIPQGKGREKFPESS